MIYFDLLMQIIIYSREILYLLKGKKEFVIFFPFFFLQDKAFIKNKQRLPSRRLKRQRVGNKNEKQQLTTKHRNNQAGTKTN